MNFNGKFWHKPGHLGMTTVQVKEALAGGGGGSIVLLDTEYDNDTGISVTKDTYSFEDLKTIFSTGKVPAVYIPYEYIGISEEEKVEEDLYQLAIFSSLGYQAASDDDPTVAVPTVVNLFSNNNVNLYPDIDDISTFNKSTKYFWTTEQPVG